MTNLKEINMLTKEIDSEANVLALAVINADGIEPLKMLANKLLSLYSKRHELLVNSCNCGHKH